MSTARAMGNLSLAGMGISAMMGKIASGTMAVVQAAAKYDSLQVRLKGIEGGALGASAAFSKLQELSKLPGLGFEQAADAYAGLRSLKQDGPEAIAIIEAMARANASMGGGAEEFGRAMRQMQQIVGKGKLQAEEITTIAESIPNFRALLLDAFGTTDAAAINAKYSMDEFLAGVVNASKKLPPPAETITNNLDNLNDSWTRLMASFGNTSAIKSATGALSGMIEKMAIAMEETPKLMANLESASAGARARRDKKDEGFLSKTLSKSVLVKQTYGYLGTASSSQSQSAQEYAKFMSTYVAPAPMSKSEVDAYIKAQNDAIKREKQTMSAATGGKKSSAAKGRDVNVDFWSTGADLAATQFDWNNRRGIDRGLADRRKQAAKEEQDAIAEISAQEIAFYKEIQDQKAEIVRENTERIQGYYVDLAQSSSAVLAQSFAQIGEGFGAMADAMLSGFKNMMIQMAAEVAANAIVFGVLNLFSGGAAGTFAKGFTGLSGLLMGHATGGYVGGGEASIVGERRSEIFVPRSAGRIEPTTTSAGQSITIIVRNPAEAQSTARALRKDARQRNTGIA
ncbi:MAG: tape measure protein [Fibrobacteres bacterium]|nr:tape measure protein [Fibrobacterota bacterium]